MGGGPSGGGGGGGGQPAPPPVVQKDRKQIERGKGRAGKTLLTSGKGILDDVPTVQKALLGG